MRKLMAFSRLKNIFSRFNPLNSFKWNEPEEEIIVPPSPEELLEKAIKNYPEFKYVILVAIYHLINTQGVEDEYLTVLTKDLRFIADLVKGEGGTVEIPEDLKNEPVSNILLTCHNHFQKAIIPSSIDLRNVFKPNIRFTVIVSEDRIGIIVNELGNKFFEFNKDELKLFEKTWKRFSDYIVFCLNQERPNDVLKFYLADDESEEQKEKFQKLYDEFVGENIDKFVDEFNIRYKKYKTYYINIRL